MPVRDIVVVGASAGGVEALQTLTRGLTAGLPAAVFVVLHVPRDSMSVLPSILSRVGVLPARHAHDGEAIEHGRIYVAPPNRHLLLKPGRVVVEVGADEHRQRPAIDPLFRSAAFAYGRRVIGIVLSGTLDDGTDGLALVKARGGLAVVQDPGDAAFSAMPASAMEGVDVDHALPVARIGPLVERLVREPLPLVVPPLPAESEPTASLDDMDDVLPGERPPLPSPFSCPDCRGVLWEGDHAGRPRFRCRVGHAFSLESLAAAQDDGVDEALWSAVRALEERRAVAERVVKRAIEAGHAPVVQRLSAQMQRFDSHADTIRRMLGVAPRRRK